MAAKLPIEIHATIPGEDPTSLGVLWVDLEVVPAGKPGGHAVYRLGMNVHRALQQVRNVLDQAAQQEDCEAYLDQSYSPESERLRSERDQAREECGHEKRMRAFVSGERDRFIDLLKRAEAERDRLAATLNQARAALAGHPRCEKHAGDDPITCGWKKAVLDVQAAIEGTDS